MVYRQYFYSPYFNATTQNEKDERRNEQSEKKKEKEKLYEEEFGKDTKPVKGSSSSSSSAQPNKLTQAQIAAARARVDAQRAPVKTDAPTEMEEMAPNPNVFAATSGLEARNVEDAISILKSVWNYDLSSVYWLHHSLDFND